MAAINLNRTGFGQVEPNHLSAQRTGQIYAQLPAATATNILENGQFVKYDYKAGEVNTTGLGEWMLVFNEIKNYRPEETAKDFALKKTNAVGNVMVPRVFKTNVGDIYTTNCVGVANTAGNVAVTDNVSIDVETGTKLTPDTTGYLKVSENGDEDMIWEAVEVTTMPDGQKAVKLMRIK